MLGDDKINCDLINISTANLFVNKTALTEAQIFKQLIEHQIVISAWVWEIISDCCDNLFTHCSCVQICFDYVYCLVLDSAVRHGYAILEFCNLGNSKLPHIMNVMKIFGKYLHGILQ